MHPSKFHRDFLTVGAISKFWSEQALAGGESLFFLHEECYSNIFHILFHASRMVGPVSGGIVEQRVLLESRFECLVIWTRAGLEGIVTKVCETADSDVLVGVREVFVNLLLKIMIT